MVVFLVLDVAILSWGHLTYQGCLYIWLQQLTRPVFTRATEFTPQLDTEQNCISQATCSWFPHVLFACHLSVSVVQLYYTVYPFSSSAPSLKKNNIAMVFHLLMYAANPLQHRTSWNPLSLNHSIFVSVLLQLSIATSQSTYQQLVRRMVLTHLWKVISTNEFCVSLK